MVGAFSTRRFSAACLAALALAACGGAPPAAKLISDRCLRDGEALTVCRCLGERSERQLEAEFLVILTDAAQGRLDEADKAAAALPAERAEAMVAQLARIDSECRPQNASPASG